VFSKNTSHLERSAGAYREGIHNQEGAADDTHREGVLHGLGDPLLGCRAMGHLANIVAVSLL
jgi:hypothetical protein